MQIYSVRWCEVEAITEHYFAMWAYSHLAAQSIHFVNFHIVNYTQVGLFPAHFGDTLPPQKETTPLEKTLKLHVDEETIPASVIIIIIDGKFGDELSVVVWLSSSQSPNY